LTKAALQIGPLEIAPVPQGTAASLIKTTEKARKMDVSTARNLIASGVGSIINANADTALVQFSAEIDALAEQVAAYVPAPVETKDEAADPLAAAMVNDGILAAPAVEDSAPEITVTLAPHTEADREAETMAVAAGEHAAEI
jgi:hypothetical protein